MKSWATMFDTFTKESDFTFTPFSGSNRTCEESPTHAPLKSSLYMTTGNAAFRTHWQHQAIIHTRYGEAWPSAAWEEAIETFLRGTRFITCYVCSIRRYVSRWNVAIFNFHHIALFPSSRGERCRCYEMFFTNVYGDCRSRRHRDTTSQ